MAETPLEKPEKTRLYHEVSKRIDDWLTLHQDETFDLDLVCRHLEIASAEGRKEAATKLLHEVKKGKLEKSNKIYRYIVSTSKYIDWVNAKVSDTVPLFFPYGIEDNTRFGFDGHIIIPQKSIIIIAGVSNTGKTTFAQNLLWLNMDLFPCTLIGNEYDASQFKRRIANMTFRDPMNDKNEPKFELIERHRDWKDIIRPDNINLIDWLNMGDKFYELGTILEGIKEKLNKGIALVCIQKDPGKTYGMGGMWGMHLAALYLSMDFGRMTVEKCKEWEGHNPNREVYGFDIVNHGTQFHGIRSVMLCRKCWGKHGNTKCELCNGKGYMDSENNTCEVRE